jgi:hypothetical protein
MGAPPTPARVYGGQRQDVHELLDCRGKVIAYQERRDCGCA